MYGNVMVWMHGMEGMRETEVLEWSNDGSEVMMLDSIHVFLLLLVPSLA